MVSGYAAISERPRSTDGLFIDFPWESLGNSLVVDVGGGVGKFAFPRLFAPRFINGDRWHEHGPRKEVSQPEIRCSRQSAGHHAGPYRVGERVPAGSREQGYADAT